MVLSRIRDTVTTSPGVQNAKREITDLDGINEATFMLIYRVTDTQF